MVPHALVHLAKLVLQRSPAIANCGMTKVITAAATRMFSLDRIAIPLLECVLESSDAHRAQRPAHQSRTRNRC